MLFHTIKLSLIASVAALLLCHGASAQSPQESTYTVQTADVNMPKLHAVIGNEIQSFAYITPMAAAPNISSEQVIIVASSNNPNGESIAKNQVTTAYDEGGVQMQIGVLEIGYGTSSPYMTMA